MSLRFLGWKSLTEDFRNAVVFWRLEPRGGVTINREEKVYDFFKVQNVDNELLSEDYNFCHMYRERGGAVWVAPWCELGHFGAYLFSGQYAQSGGLEDGSSLH